MWVIDDKTPGLLANTGGLGYMGEPLIIVTATVTVIVIDVSRGSGSV